MKTNLLRGSSLGTRIYFKNFRFYYALLCCLAFIATANAQVSLAKWEFNTSGGSTTKAAYVKDANISATNLSTSFGSGLSAINFLGNGFTASAQMATTLAEAISGNEYISFKIAPISGKSVTINSINYRPVSQNRARSFALFSSKNGFAAGNVMATNSHNGGNGAASVSITISNHASIPTETEFRIYIYGASPNTYESAGLGESTGDDLEIVGTTANAGDAQAPSVPTGLSSASISQTSFTLNWAASTDNVGVTGYEVFRNGSSIGTPSSTSYNVTGLSANTAYSMSVRARDAAGNWSAQSSTLSVTTSAATGGGPSGFTLCSSEGQTCLLTGTMDVAYGANGSFNYLTNRTGSIDCSNATFGDPIAGVVKSCYVKNSAGGGTQGLNYQYYEGTFSVLPNFGGLSTVKTGTVDNFDLTPRNRNDQFAFRYTGNINIATAGAYTFFTTSDDGSKLYINGTQVVNNDGLHGMQEASGNITLAAGSQTIEVTFFENGGGEGLEVRYSGPGISKQLIPNSVLSRSGSGGDTQAPSVPAGISSANVSQTSFTLNWNASTDNVGVTGYEVFRGSTSIGTPTATSFNVTGLTANTAYSMRVRARDAASNWSAQSTALNVTTSANTGGGTPITVTKATKYQTIDGFGFFGAEDVWWSGGALISDAWADLIISDLGVSIWRNELYPPADQYSGQDADWAKQRPVVISINNKALEYNVPLKHIFTVWSPPSSMKCAINSDIVRQPAQPHTSGAKWGGALDPTKYPQFADWLKTGIQNYANEGINVYAISPQNEPYFVQPFNSCFYQPSWYVEMINGVIPALKQAYPNVKVFGAENMLDMEGRDINIPWFYQTAIKNNTSANNLMDIVAVHGYSDGVAASSGSNLNTYWTNVKNEYVAPFGKRAWMTETSGYTENWENTTLGDGTVKPGALSLAQDIYSGLKYGNMSGWVWWQGSENGGANVSDYSLMSRLVTNRKYAASKHFYRYIRPNARRVEATTTDSDLFVTAYEHTGNGTNTVVIINNGTSSKPVNVSGANLPGSYTIFRSTNLENCLNVGTYTTGNSLVLPAKSLVTLQAGGTPLGGRMEAETNVIEETGLQVYPNPAENEVNISGLSDNATIELRNVDGKSLFSGTFNSATAKLSLANVPAGLYILKINDSFLGAKTVKISKN